jgi:predicted dehydrogenase
MPQQHRRQFLKTLAAAATVTLAGTKSTGRVLGSNETIRIGVAGINGRGHEHIRQFAGMQGVQVTYLIDPDSRIHNSRAQQVHDRGGNTPRTVQDIRTALEDRNLDAVSVATPNHWHTLITVWAAQHGKHVYVEKPCSHNVKEGRIATEMARRHNVIVQHGTQSRSDPAWINTIAQVRSGRYGRLLIARALCYKPRPSIGTRPNGDVPTGVDFNLWLGPASQQPYHANLVHYNWHWFWDFGNGDIGNQGVHQMDIARWAIADATLPRSVICVGGRYGYSDQGQTPNTQVAVLDFGQTQLIFEVRGLPTGGFRGQSVGNVFHTEEGLIAGNRFFRNGTAGAGEPLPRIDPPARGGPGGGDHFANFIAAIRSGRREDLNADILDGHYSSALCHLANVSYRLGRQVRFAPQPEPFGQNAPAMETLARMEDHLSTAPNSLQLSNLDLTAGVRLEIDATNESVRNNEQANRLLTRPYRAPFVVPERVG